MEPQSEQETSSELGISQSFGTDGHSRSRYWTFGQGVFTKRDGSALQTHRLVLLSLGLLNAVLLIAAAVIGIYCAKAKDLQTDQAAATPLIIERNYLRNQSDIIRAKLEAQAALARERTNHVQLKLQVKQKKTSTDVLQKKIETLLTEKTNLQINKTTLEETCDRCQPGWILLKSSCYYFSHVPDSKKNWPDSRADCISRGGDLLVINNIGEQQLITDNFPKVSSSGMWWQDGFWIGLTDVIMRGTWVWVNNVTETETMYWRSGQPNPSGPQSGNCAAFYYYIDARGTWYNGNCQDHLLNWICEKEPVQA